MRKIMIVGCKQEVSSFNPVPSSYQDFLIETGDELMLNLGKNTEIGGALSVFSQEVDVEAVPLISAYAVSAGKLSSEGWEKLSGRLMNEIEPQVSEIDAVYTALHGAMAADGELDPEGDLLERIRARVGPDVPIVASLDLHGILTDKMIRNLNGLTAYKTYPHVDFADTGARAARLLLGIMRREVKPVLARSIIPALVRGNDLITSTGCYGDLLRYCQTYERAGDALAAEILIGNPFTDVPELSSQVIIQTHQDPDTARALAEQVAGEFWRQRHHMQTRLVSLDTAIEQARWMKGPVVFTDAADATSSGATGDSNVILAALLDAGYQGTVLAPIVDAPAAAVAHAAGVGAEIEVKLGGTRDPARFKPLPVTARVKLLSDGSARLETMKRPLESGPSAVITFGNFTVVVLSKPVRLFDRSPFFANGCNPQDFDLTILKSPHAEHHMFDEWAENNFHIDAPGATSADLTSLGHTVCKRPVFPLDQSFSYTPSSQLYWTH